MNRIALALCIAVVASGCGSSESPGNPPRRSDSGLASSVTADGVYEVGKDLQPGVYTAKGECVAYSASTASFDIMDDQADDDAYLTSAMPVGDRQRIELHDGEFFTSRSCGTWTREDKGRSTSADPASRAGACEILVGRDRLVDGAMAFADDRVPDEARRDEIQEKLFTVVVANDKELSDPAGQLIDFLDDPKAYLESGKPAPIITNAVSKIRKVCKSG